MWRIVAVLAMVVLAACSRGSAQEVRDDESADTTSGEARAAVPPDETATTGPASPEGDVLAAYQGYWDTWLDANDPPDPFHPGLTRYYTGVALERARASIETNMALGHAVRLPADARYAHRAEVVELLADSATVMDCAVDDSQLLTLERGSILNDSVLTSRARAVLQRTDGMWKVAEVTVLDRWEGAVACDV